VAWPAGEVEALNAARIAGKGEADIRALVAKLQAARAGAVGLKGHAMHSANATRAAHIPTSPHTFQHADPAARAIEGEQRARDRLDRMHLGMAQPDELAVIVAYLYGELLQGFCRLVQKALERGHG
jgi:hypothetical protein